jgi:hypothetical protein
MLGVSCFFIVMSPECRVGGKSGDAGVGFRGLVDAAHPIGREGASQSWRRNHVEAARGQLQFSHQNFLTNPSRNRDHFRKADSHRGRKS